jgi:hypothetical protein
VRNKLTYEKNMTDKKSHQDSRFKTAIRVDPVQKELIKKFKGRYSQAGFLDMVINHFWKCSSAQKEMERRGLQKSNN